MKWDDFKPTYESYRYKITDIECPECGERIYQDTHIVLTSYPPKFCYICRKCGWKGYK